MKSQNNSDAKYISLCLKLAKKGYGQVSPNPMVGAVIVKNNKILSQGYHKKAGKEHAEVVAVREAGEKAKSATLYVNLEPCSHYGKTPPCTDLIIKTGIAKVVCSQKDPNPIVNGKGIKKLREHGIKVKVGVLEHEARELNKIFNFSHKNELPFITLKSSMTSDLKITGKKNSRERITNDLVNKYVNILRAGHDAVLIGANTLKVDDPKLLSLNKYNNSLKRIVLTSNLNIDFNLKIFNDEFAHNTIIVTGNTPQNRLKAESLKEKKFNIIFAPLENKNRLILTVALKRLKALQINSVLVEAGAEIFTSFYEKGLFNEIFLFFAPKIFVFGVRFTNSKLPSFLKVKSVKKFKDNFLIVLTKK